MMIASTSAAVLLTDSLPSFNPAEAAFSYVLNRVPVSESVDFIRCQH